MNQIWSAGPREGLRKGFAPALSLPLLPLEAPGAGREKYGHMDTSDHTTPNVLSIHIFKVK